MTNREKEILKILRENPMISQQQIADTLGIVRSSVAVHITNLMKKGLIKGKGYILDESNYVTVIGGSNMDIVGFPFGKLKLMDSNPGTVKVSLGGVGRNISENITKLGIDTKLITALGDDLYGQKILDECKISGIDMGSSLVIKNASSSTYLSVMDETGDMKVAIAHMDIIDQLDIGFIRKNDNVIKNSKCIVVDTNLKQEVLEYLLTTYRDKDFFLDTVSTTKAMKIKECIGYFHTIKPNRIEAQELSGITISSSDDVKKAIQYFLDKGVENVIISLGEKGVAFGNKDGVGILKNQPVNVVNATGAGDAFIAGLVYAYTNGLDLETGCKYSMAAAMMALGHENTINPNLSVERVELIVEEME